MKLAADEVVIPENERLFEPGSGGDNVPRKLVSLLLLKLMLEQEFPVIWGACEKGYQIPTKEGLATIQLCNHTGSALAWSSCCGMSR